MKKPERMMEDWAKHCGAVARAENVVALNRKGQ
jgi:hypothetical protein